MPSLGHKVNILDVGQLFHFLQIMQRARDMELVTERYPKLMYNQNAQEGHNFVER